MSLDVLHYMNWYPDVFPREVLLYIRRTESRISCFTLPSFSFSVIKIN